jgi:tetratricopeptide (TPR) repeat protein
MEQKIQISNYSLGSIMIIFFILCLLNLSCNDIKKTEDNSDKYFQESNRYFFKNQEKEFYRIGVNLINKSIQIDSNFIDGYYRLAWFYNAMKEHDSAIIILNKLISKRPNYHYYLFCGMIYEKIQNDSSTYYYNKADSLINIEIEKNKNNVNLIIESFKIKLFIHPKQEVISELQSLSKKVKIFPLLPSDSVAIFDFNREMLIKEL